jgi:hypothetical protein
MIANIPSYVETLIAKLQENNIPKICTQKNNFKYSFYNILKSKSNL